jgi:hypothetical protein
VETNVDQKSNQKQSQQQLHEIKNRLQSISITTWSLISMLLGLLSFIFVFYPEIQTLTLIVAIIAYLSNVIIYYASNGNFFAQIGIIASSIPLLFFLFLELLQIYLKVFGGEILKSIF